MPESIQTQGFLARQPLLPALIEGLQLAFGIKALNSTQNQILPSALQPNVKLLLAAETGSGKTLGYLLPIMQKLKMEEEVSSGHCRMPKSPRALILVPSAELAQQVGTVAKQLSHHVKLRVGFLTRAMALDSKAFDRLFESGPLDLLVTTPFQAIKGLEEGRFDLDSVKHLTVDEADSMVVDDTFRPQLDKILLELPTSQALRIVDQLDTLIFASASISEAVKDTLKAGYGALTIVASEELHKPLRTNRYNFISVEGPGDAKLIECIRLLDTHKDEPTLVFCNGAPAASALHSYLERHYAEKDPQRALGLLHGWIPEHQRLQFLTHARAEKRSLICTDLLARGVDTTDWIKHVIMFDFPPGPLEFLHRAGRAGRAGRRGRVSCLVSHKDRRLAEYIRLSILQKSRLGRPLPVAR